MRIRVLSAAFLLFVAFGHSSSRAQSDLPFSLPVPVDGVETYSGDIPTPEDVIGHQIGTRHTEPHQAVAYFEAVAEASDRVLLETHARSYEGRPLVHAVVSSAENIRNIEEIRQQNLRLSEAPESVSDSEISEMPAVIYAGYSIHGNEPSGTEAALLFIYHLAAGQGAGIEQALEDVVLIIDPLFNPDGRERFTTWKNMNRGTVPVSDPNDREHDEPWPYGRTNHYWFDLNRDWLPAQHPESQGRIAVFHRWRPQVLTDHHEMNSAATFFFQPGIPSRNNPNTPERTFELTGRLSKYHASALDEIGSLYYSKESYDDYYYGKGSTYPDINGAVGILFEQAASRSLELETDRGTLTYPFTIRNQLVTSLSTLRGVVELREDLLRHQRDFYASADELAAEVEAKAYVIGTGRTPHRSAALADLLRRHRIRIHDLSRDFQADGATFRPGEAYIVPVDQPQAHLVNAAMERVSTFPDSLFYDVSTWTLPLAFGVDYAEVHDDASRYVGREISGDLHAAGRVVGGQSEYGYVMEWGSYYAPRALYRLQKNELLTRVIQEPFTAQTAAGQREFPRGSIVIPVSQTDVDDDGVHRIVEEAARENFLDVYALNSGLTSVGPDIGTGESEDLAMPRIALLTGSGTWATNAGEVWHLLSERFRIPVSLLDLEDVEGANLARYNTIVMAGGSYSSLPVDKIKTWVREGGRIVAIREGAEWAAEQGFVNLELKELDLDSLYRDLPYEALSRARGAQNVGGAILAADVDNTHPVAYGYPSQVPVFRRGETFFVPSKEPGRNVAVYADEPLMSGYISEEMLEQARGSASIVADRYGQGRVTLFMDNPNFRAFWYGTNGLFLNAIFFGQAY